MNGGRILLVTFLSLFLANIHFEIALWIGGPDPCSDKNPGVAGIIKKKPAAGLSAGWLLCGGQHEMEESRAGKENRLPYRPYLV
jgi:hypothetical protein